MIVSKELYDSLKNIKNFEEFEDFVDSLQTNDNESINNNSIIVRLPSESEYNLYIETDSLNGCITKNDVNVWHTHVNSNQDVVYNTQNVTAPPTKYVTVNFLFEMFENNNDFNISTNDKSNSYFVWIGCFCEGDNTYRSEWYHATQNNWGGYASTQHNVFNVNRSKNYYGFSERHYIRTYNSRNINCAQDVTINFSMCFRPIFNYMDNHKSNNIFN